MQTQITKEWHWSLAIGSVMLVPAFYERRGSHPMYEANEPDPLGKAKGIEKRKRPGRYSGSRQLDKDIAVMRGHIEAYLRACNELVPPKESYAHFINLNQLTYSTGNVMSYLIYCQNLRIVRVRMGLPTYLRKNKSDSILALYDKGKTIDEISLLITDYNKKGIRQALIRRGRVITENIGKKHKHEKIVDLFKAGKNVSEITVALDSSKKYVKNILFSKNLLSKKSENL